jgi:hypothetical protein
MRRNEQQEGKGRVFALGAAIGAAATWLLERGRWKRVADQTAGKGRRLWRGGGRAGRAVTAEAYGVTQKVQHLKEEPKEFDDATLKSKVETELFRDADVPKGQINVNAQDGVVQLRGEVPTPDMINDLVDKTRKIQGVKDVENLLHLPKTPAPSRTDTPARQRKTRRSPAKQARRKAKLRESMGERTPEGAEPKPADLVRERAGRQPPPMGSSEEGPEERG